MLTAIGCLKSLLLQRSLDRSGDSALWLVIMACISVWYRLFACSTASFDGPCECVSLLLLRT